VIRSSDTVSRLSASFVLPVALVRGPHFRAVAPPVLSLGKPANRIMRTPPSRDIHTAEGFDRCAQKERHARSSAAASNRMRILSKRKSNSMASHTVAAAERKSQEL
jgi:hypothetical protein